MIVVSERNIIEIRCYFDCLLYTRAFDMQLHLNDPSE